MTTFAFACNSRISKEERPRKSPGAYPNQSELAKSNRNTTCLDYRQTTIPAAIYLRPYIVATYAKFQENMSQITCGGDTWDVYDATTPLSPRIYHTLIENTIISYSITYRIGTSAWYFVLKENFVGVISCYFGLGEVYNLCAKAIRIHHY